MIVVCGLVWSGCGSSNESKLKGESKAAAPKGDMPDFQSFTEFQQYNMQKAKEAPKKGYR
jgi:hypothetical protein